MSHFWFIFYLTQYTVASMSAVISIIISDWMLSLQRQPCLLEITFPCNQTANVITILKGMRCSRWMQLFFFFKAPQFLTESESQGCSRGGWLTLIREFCMWLCLGNKSTLIKVARMKIYFWFTYLGNLWVVWRRSGIFSFMRSAP